MGTGEVKVNFDARPPIYLERKPSYVLTVASQSQPGRKHFIVVWPDDSPMGCRAECSCDGWQYNRKCWHVDEVVAKNWVVRIHN